MGCSFISNSRKINIKLSIGKYVLIKRKHSFGERGNGCSKSTPLVKAEIEAENQSFKISK